MNSAEKKAPEPSMDDIISSIRNIISDEPQESAPVPQAEMPAPVAAPVVQLTENQIAAPVAADIAPPAVIVPDAIESIAVPMAPLSEVREPVAVAPSPETPPVVNEPVIAQTTIMPVEDQPLNSAQVASEIDTVPGVMVAAREPQPMATLVQPELPPLAAPLVPEATAPLPTLLEPGATLEGTTLPPASSIMAPAQDEKPISLTTRLDDLSSPSMAATLDTPIAEVMPNGVAAPIDPIEDLIEVSSGPGYEETFEQANGVNPDQILDGMASGPQDLSEASVGGGLAAFEPDNNSVSAPVVDVLAENVPVVLDASKVTPEDAMAISAVAAATSEALAGTSDIATTAAPSSLEDSIKAMLKPMIKDWLDDNMPRILEGAIKEEVKDSGDDDKV